MIVAYEGCRLHNISPQIFTTHTYPHEHGLEDIFGQDLDLPVHLMFFPLSFTFSLTISSLSLLHCFIVMHAYLTPE